MTNTDPQSDLLELGSISADTLGSDGPDIEPDGLMPKVGLCED